MFSLYISFWLIYAYCQEPTFTDIFNFYFQPNFPLSFIQVSILTIAHHWNKTRQSNSWWILVHGDNICASTIACSRTLLVQHFSEVLQLCVQVQTAELLVKSLLRYPSSHSLSIVELSTIRQPASVLAELDLLKTINDPPKMFQDHCQTIWIDHQHRQLEVGHFGQDLLRYMMGEKGKDWLMGSLLLYTTTKIPTVRWSDHMTGWHRHIQHAYHYEWAYTQSQAQGHIGWKYSRRYHLLKCDSCHIECDYITHYLSLFSFYSSFMFWQFYWFQHVTWHAYIISSKFPFSW